MIYHVTLSKRKFIKECSAGNQLIEEDYYQLFVDGCLPNAAIYC